MQPVLARTLSPMPPRRQTVGRCNSKHTHTAPVLGQQPGRLNGFRCDGARIHDGKPCPRLRPAQPVSAVDDVGFHRIRQLACGLIQRPCGQAQIYRTALLVAMPALFLVLFARALHVVERPAHDDTEFIDISWLEVGETVLRHADQRRADGLVSAAFRSQRDARRRGRENEAGVLVAGVVQRIETTTDERVVERPNRDQPLAEQRVRQPGGRQRQEQVHLGDAEFDMLALGAHLPLLGRHQPAFLEHIFAAGHREQAAPIDPRAKVGRHGDVRGRGDDAIRQRAALLGDIVEDAAEPGLCRNRPLRLRNFDLGNRYALS